jgi:hypothetical protein
MILGFNSFELKDKTDNTAIEKIYPGITAFQPKLATESNIELTSKLGGAAANLGASIAGVPQVAQVSQALIDGTTNNAIYSQYAVAKAQNNFKIPGLAYQDFRSFKGYTNTVTEKRIDGTSAALRNRNTAPKSAIYAAASIAPGGAYNIFNLDGAGKTGFGWGDHGNPYAFRNDFTVGSHIRTTWDKDKWVPITRKNQLRNAKDIATAFRGDRVTVIDYGERTLANAYQWRPTQNILGASLTDKTSLTQDFIKFYLTGPKLTAGNTTDTDHIIVFRAIINSLSDTFSPSWTAQSMIGRADPNYHYTQVTRDLQMDFTVYATDRDEIKPIWRKLNALAGYTAPTYDSGSIAMTAPFMRITIGDLFVQQAVIITSLTYTLHDSDTTWELNIENDATMMQTPHKIAVSLGLTPIMDYLPQNQGRFYSLAKKFTNATPIKGDDNWLSDFKDNIDDTVESVNKDTTKEKTIPGIDFVRGSNENEGPRFTRQ